MTDLAESQRELLELQRKVAELEAQTQLAKFELDREQAVARAQLGVLEATLAAERELCATVERTASEQQAMNEDIYEARIALLRAELELWRRDDRPSLLEFLTARVASLDSSLAYLDSSESGEPSPAMTAAIERARAERDEILAVQARLRR